MSTDTIINEDINVQQINNIFDEDNKYKEKKDNNQNSNDKETKEDKKLNLIPKAPVKIHVKTKVRDEKESISINNNQLAKNRKKSDTSFSNDHKLDSSSISSNGMNTKNNINHPNMKTSDRNNAGNNYKIKALNKNINSREKTISIAEDKKFNEQNKNNSSNVRTKDNHINKPKFSNNCESSNHESLQGLFAHKPKINKKENPKSGINIEESINDDINKTCSYRKIMKRKQNKNKSIVNNTSINIEFDGNVSFNNDLSKKEVEAKGVSEKNGKETEMGKNNKNNLIIQKNRHFRTKSCEYNGIASDVYYKKNIDINKTELENSNINSNKRVNFEEMLERFKLREDKINNKIESLRKKIEDEENLKMTKQPYINKNNKYYENNPEGFLKRVEIHKFVSEVKKLELIEKNQKRLQDEFNKNPANGKLMKLKEIQSIIEEKLNIERRKKLEKEEKIRQLEKEREETLLIECTFKPEISENSKKMDLSSIRSKYELTKSTSMPKFIDTENNLKYHKFVNLETSYTNHNKSLRNINSNNKNLFIEDKVQNNKKGNKIDDLQKNDGNILKESHSVNKFANNKGSPISLNDNDNKKKNDYLMNCFNDASADAQTNDINNISINTKKNYVPISTEKNFVNSNLNISKKESDIMKELLRRKYNM